MPKMLLAVLCLVLVAQAARADISVLCAIVNDPDVEAQSLAPQQETSVAMEAERVDVSLTENNAHVKATFSMRNTSDSLATLEVGFPGQHFGVEGMRIANLKVTVGEADQAYEFRASNPAPGDERSGWFVWQMTFEEGQERTIVVEYDCKTHFGSGDLAEWTNADEIELDKYEGRGPESEEAKADAASPDEAASQPLEILRLKRNREFTYILATGATWHGPIGEGVVSIKLADDAARSIESLKGPSTPSWRDDTITWSFKDLEPTDEHNVVVRYRQGTHHALGLKPGIESLLAALKDRSNEHWNDIVELAKRIGTKECLDALE